MKSFTHLLPLLLLLAVLLLPRSFARPQVPCELYVPSTDAAEGICDVYNVSSTASAGPFSYSNGSFNYLFSICEHVSPSAVPEVCKNVSQSVAYQYDSKTCYSLGDLGSIAVVR